ncbi:hypothetical protein ZHAS_00014132 [Anopheles sinensis]|uniref:Secreted protein n=1 Tax=Anopheles sinensis TaxID=74873 RepID=A0A084W7Q0_ANOSI|nr:hypothetical protein ZHAS_00014132 [Anopheles sinensis]
MSKDIHGSCCVFVRLIFIVDALSCPVIVRLWSLDGEVFERLTRVSSNRSGGKDGWMAVSCLRAMEPASSW